MPRGRGALREHRVVSTQQISHALDGYRPASEQEVADVGRIRTALGREDVFSPSSPLHVTGSALVVHPESGRVLLRWHTKMQQWMQVGGHFDPGETDPREVALREAREETGLRDLAVVGDAPVQVVVVPVPAHGDVAAHEHADLRYVFVTHQPELARAESSAARLKWTALATASGEVGEDNLRVFLARTRAMIDAMYPRDDGPAKA